jgi:hypothetical protein
LFVSLERSTLALSRRLFLGTALASLAAATARPGEKAPPGSGGLIAPGLLQRTLDALQRHRGSLDYLDTLGIADFSLPSRTPRFYLLTLANGNASAHWVAHGRGSDPAHTGWLERFSNEPRSNATSAGAYRTEGLYTGSHGHSLRLTGLEPSNSNAAARAIVVHGAGYVSQQIIEQCGRLGRSEGCFAVAPSSLTEILTRLGPGRLIYADKA